MATTPSIIWPRMTSSIESATTSRLMSEVFIPSVPIVTPSLMAIVLNSIGVPPAARMPALTATASSRWLMLQGIVSIQVVPTPMMRLGEVLVGEADGLEHRAGAGTVGAVGDRRRMALGGVGGVGGVGHLGVSWPAGECGLTLHGLGSLGRVGRSGQCSATQAPVSTALVRPIPGWMWTATSVAASA